MLQSYDQGLYIHVSPELQSTGHVFGFDLDWTLVRPVHGISTKNGIFPRTTDDFAFLPNRLRVLRDLIERGFTVVICTNQKSCNRDKLHFNIDRVNNIIKFLEDSEIQIIVLMSTQEDHYRKPETGMWDSLIQMFDVKTGLYCGDAAGRPQDFADSDLQFALKSGIDFILPEDIFSKIELIDSTVSEGFNEIQVPEKKSMVILMGMPGSGKTTFYRSNFEPMGYVHISGDVLKRPEKMQKEVISNAIKEKMIVIDATNANPKYRQNYYEIAETYGYTVTLLYFVGDGFGFNKIRENPVPTVAYSTYYKYLKEPTDEDTPGRLYQIG